MWQRIFAKRCAEAGASVFVGHGAPLLQGVEIHRGAPLFYGWATLCSRPRSRQALIRWKRGKV
jgi:poly-gamma-glutamate capsule biosynthesis protein CapA/YwtB (metallophosphatase superfamily)